MENLWNRMVQVRNEHPNEDIREMANMLLNQYSTAGGIKIRQELINFLLH